MSSKAIFAEQLHEVPVSPETYRTLADDLGNLVGPLRSNLLVQAEAAVALEAIATEIGHAHHTLLNLVSSRYGRAFGDWATSAGATVITSVAPPRRAFNATDIDALLSAHPDVDVLQLAHGEAITGVLHPAKEIIEVAHRHRVMVVLDAVASIAASDVPSDADIVVIGPQKAIEGAAGISVVSFTDFGLSILSVECVRTPSILSLRYLRDMWLNAGRGFVPGTPSSLDIVATAHALDVLARETLCERIERHAHAAQLLWELVATAGLEVWAEEPAERNRLATAVVLPRNVDAAAIVAATGSVGEPWTNDVDGAPANVVRTTHFGADATKERIRRRFDALRDNIR